MGVTAEKNLNNKYVTLQGKWVMTFSLHYADEAESNAK